MPIFFSLNFCYSQTTFKVEDDISFPDLRVRIGEDVSYPDIRIKIGRDVSYSDFTVGVTDNKSQANFIITESNYPDYKVKASNDVSYPDLRLKVGSDVSYPDLRIKIKKSGGVDYLVYTEKDFISMVDLIIALLPAINHHTEYKNNSLNKLFENNYRVHYLGTYYFLIGYTLAIIHPLYQIVKNSIFSCRTIDSITKLI